ncbi:TonB-dependent receptor [Sphingomonas sp. GM_Shp_2]|uniref:TonB-dependent receptor n=1 Tax=Sphingomonas sp. GM_Shp_2 TaxID=2937380 RepID=UPI00226A0C2D|nr:TonB-dependent receptor [Sphingomonas sp. GM_Shp_2]
MKLYQRTLAVALSGAAIGTLGVSSAYAQTAPRTRATPTNKQYDFAIPAGPLAGALNQWARQSDRSIVFRTEDVATIETRGVEGRMTAAAALNSLLDGTGFDAVVENGAIALQRAGERSADGGTAAAGSAAGATPDILVTGQRAFTLNTGIKRSQDDSQPFIVLSGEEIRRSGAPNLETFLRDRLSVNSEPGLSEAPPEASSAGGLQQGRGLSAINLRGLGVRDTLILVDGRRQPGVNLGNGALAQAQITGIPLASIERIEVLASSASGIYGSGASGGVVNIITKRDFSGGLISARYNNTDDFKKGEGQVDLTYGIPFENGRTRLSFAGSWQKSLPLLYGDREDLARRSREQVLVVRPDLLSGFDSVPPSTTVNYRAQGGRPLQLKPQFGGAILSSPIGTVPVGFRGIALDGVAPLVAAVGSYNLERGNTTAVPGTRARMLYGSELLNGTVTLRREFNPWLTAYVSGSASRSESNTNFTSGPTSLTLAANAPNNPFTTALQIALPPIARESRVQSINEQRSIIAGAIVKLPFDWQALVDVPYATSKFTGDITPSYLDSAIERGLANGTQDVLRDLNLRPLTITYDATPFGSANEPAKSTTFTPSLRFAGPLPITLGGGKPQVTVNFEYNSDRIAATRGTFFNGNFVMTAFQPESTQKMLSYYAEVVLPVFGRANNIPLMRLLEFRVSGRGERYTGTGGAQITCFPDLASLSLDNPYGECPGSTDVETFEETSRGRIDPSLSFRWFPFESLMFRGSYTTGFLPPRLNQLTSLRGDTLISLVDTARGREAIGITPGPFGLTVPGAIGGNPDVKPESSRTVSLGTVFEPGGFLKGLRFSADWTKVKKRDIYFDPALIFAGFGRDAQDVFDRYIRAVPGAVTRAAPSDGFAVGKIIAVDARLTNLNSMSTEAVDFTLDYNGPLLGGTISASARASTILSLRVSPFPGAPIEEYRGVAPSRGFAALITQGGFKWRGSAWANWSKGPVTVGWAGRYIDSYQRNLAVTATVDLTDSPIIPSQLYHDVTFSYRFAFDATLTAGINNVFKRRPPLDPGNYPQFYSPYADPRLRHFYLGISKAF